MNNLSDTKNNMYAYPVGPPVGITFFMGLAFISVIFVLSNPLLLACAVDVVYGRSNGPFVILLVRVCVRPFQ